MAQINFAVRLLLPLFLVAAPSAHASIGASTNWGFGYGYATQDFGSHSFKPQSIAGHVDLQMNLWKFVVGLNYLTITNYNINDERNYVGMGAVHAGFNFTNSVQLIGGVGTGAWRRRRDHETSTPHSYDYSASGNGYMAGVRVFLYNSKFLSVGLSGTYYQLKNDEYSSSVNGVSSKVSEETKGSGQIAALVFRLSLDDVNKLAKK